MNLIRTLRDDLSRLGKPTLASALKWYLIPRGECFPYVVWLRILQKVRSCRVLRNVFGVPVYLIYRHFEFKYGIHANANIEICGGFRPIHGPCNLNAARIGRNFTVYSGVTIGIHKGGLPTIGDNVSVFPNAVVCGGIHIGNDASVGALTYVSRDMAPGEVRHE